MTDLSILVREEAKERAAELGFALRSATIKETFRPDGTRRFTATVVFDEEVDTDG